MHLKSYKYSTVLESCIPFYFSCYDSLEFHDHMLFLTKISTVRKLFEKGVNV